MENPSARHRLPVSKVSPASGSTVESRIKSVGQGQGGPSGTERLFGHGWLPKEEISGNCPVALLHSPYLAYVRKTADVINKRSRDINDDRRRSFFLSSLLRLALPFPPKNCWPIASRGTWLRQRVPQQRPNKDKEPP